MTEHLIDPNHAHIEYNYNKPFNRDNERETEAPRPLTDEERTSNMTPLSKEQEPILNTVGNSVATIIGSTLFLLVHFALAWVLPLVGAVYTVKWLFE